MSFAKASLRDGSRPSAGPYTQDFYVKTEGGNGNGTEGYGESV